MCRTMAESRTNGIIIWITRLSGTGKTTVARRLYEVLVAHPSKSNFPSELKSLRCARSRLEEEPAEHARSAQARSSHLDVGPAPQSNTSEGAVHKLACQHRKIRTVRRYWWLELVVMNGSLIEIEERSNPHLPAPERTSLEASRGGYCVLAELGAVLVGGEPNAGAAVTRCSRVGHQTLRQYTPVQSTATIGSVMACACRKSSTARRQFGSAP